MVSFLPASAIGEELGKEKLRESDVRGSLTTKDRSLEDLKEMDKKKDMGYRLRNIKFFNNFGEKDPFIRFNIGWDFAQIKRKVRGRKIKWETAPRKYKWVQTGTMGYRYTNDVSNVARGKLASTT